jgi:LEA14-like dessication related protein
VAKCVREIKTKTQIMKNTIFTIILIISLSSCKVQEVEVGDFRGFKLGAMNGKTVELNMQVPIKNPNKFKFKITKANLDIKLDTKELGKVTKIEKITIPAKSNAVYPINITVQLSDKLDIPSLLMSGMFKQKSKVSIKGFVKAHKFIFGRKFDVDVNKPASMFKN